MNGGYVLLDAGGLELTTGDTPVTISGIWARVKECLETGKPIVAHNLKYSTAPVSPIAVFGWYLDTDEIVLVSATIHVHVKDDNTVTTLDVAAS